MDLEKFRIGLIFRNNEIIVLGEYKDDGTMDEDTMGIISDSEEIYSNLPLNKFEVVEVQRIGEGEDEKVSLRDLHSYTIGEAEGVNSVMDIYREDPSEFFGIINELYETIVDGIAH